MSTIGAVSHSSVPMLIAQRQLQGDQALVERDANQLRQDRTRLDGDQQNLNAVLQQVRQAVQVDAHVAIRDGLDKLEQQAPAAQQVSSPPVAPQSSSTGSQSSSAVPNSPQPQSNAEGQTVGQVIDVVA